ncbi:hypothetical protein BC936DRAFT_141593 [Jimgerdemannia flammicorona]|uniref:Uncharacterized protein n=2 Tax=Jimgerdemannia flammicorona TaxID=994334 RepID=A0A433Q8Q1_9FUNG|nr:hypothetical protein BC936DRAFT_141593 [Jimgerdemannia flammicorona]RUS26188.1 hypothetical protein BC938DRAFT_471106 [Jimgerdemannia flammicorona]
MAEIWTPNTLKLFAFPLPSPPQETEPYFSDIPTTYALSVPTSASTGELTITTFNMSSQSPSLPTSSPQPMRQSAYSWPIPVTTITTPTATNPPTNLLSSGCNSPTTLAPFGGRSFADITIREILEEYKDLKNDTELLKNIFMAKAEEDKRRTAEEATKAEQAKIQFKQLELELLREQNKTGSRYNYAFGSQPSPSNSTSTYTLASPQALGPTDLNHPVPPMSPITGPTPYMNTYMAPLSPSAGTPTDYAPSVHTPQPFSPYTPHAYGSSSPSSSTRTSFPFPTLTTAPQQLHVNPAAAPSPVSPYGNHPTQSPMSPIAPDYHHQHSSYHTSPPSSTPTTANLPSPGISGPATRKRSRSSTNFGSDGMTNSRHGDPLVSPLSASHCDSPTDASGKQLSHDQVMEALKAKVLRNNSANSVSASSTATATSPTKSTHGSNSPRASSASNRPNHRRSTSSTSVRSYDDYHQPAIKKSSSPSIGSASPSPIPPHRFITPIDLKVVHNHRHEFDMVASSSSTLSSAGTITSATTPASSIGGHPSPLLLCATRRSASLSPRLGAAAVIGSAVV